MSPAAFHRRVGELEADSLMTFEEAVRQAAWEIDHGRTPIDVPVVAGRTG